jgi:hypothetical protein
MEWVGVALGAVDLISGIIGGSKASSAAKRQAREEARLEGILTTEKVRQLDVEARLREGEMKAGYASGRVKIGSQSALQLLAEQRKQFLHERSTILEVGASKAANALQRGSNLASQIRYGSISDAAGKAAGLAGTFGSIFAKTPKTTAPTPTVTVPN